MIRDDLSNKLIHLIRGDTIDHAFEKFHNILKERLLRGGTGYIKGGYTCVCFTETPIAKLAYVFANPDLKEMRYRPFGIMLDKHYTFDRGARPVIYQPDADFSKLDEELRYRHVRFELTNPSYPIDLTWEREWRIKTDILPLPVDTTTVIVPNRYWRDVLVEEHANHIQGTVLSLGSDAALAVEPYPWHLVVLEDLGIAIPDGL
jgi:hypothetical protein